MSRAADVSLVLQRINRGEQQAVAELFPLVYDELRLQAQRFMGRERRGHTLQATALVNEAFVRMAGRGTSRWESRRHFFNAAAEAMRKLLVDYARRRNSLKRGREHVRVDLESAHLTDDEPEVDYEALDMALAKLQTLGERRYRVVMYRYFCGQPEQVVAQLLGVTVKTVQRDWKTARIFLAAEIDGDRGAETENRP